MYASPCLWDVEAQLVLSCTVQYVKELFTSLPYRVDVGTLIHEEGP